MYIHNSRKFISLTLIPGLFLIFKEQILFLSGCRRKVGKDEQIPCRHRHLSFNDTHFTGFITPTICDYFDTHGYKSKANGRHTVNVQIKTSTAMTYFLYGTIEQNYSTSSVSSAKIISPTCTFTWINYDKWGKNTKDIAES